MNRLALAATVAAFALPFAAHAAPAAGPTWDGPYVGLNVGYGLGNTTIDDQDCNVSCSSQNFTPSGVSVGGDVGFNHRMGSAVIGLEGDYNYLDARSRKVTDWPSIHTANLNSYGSVRARAGVVVDNAFVYATAGLGILSEDVSAIDTGCDGGCNGFRLNTTKVGLAAGVGAEVALHDHWMVKMEYLHVGAPADPNIHDQIDTECGSFCNFGVKSSLDVVRVGMDYAF